MSGQKPSVGRIVHYVSHGTPVRPDGSQAYTSQCRAAIVTAVNGHAISPATGEEAPERDVALCVLNPTGLFFHESVPHHGGDPGHVDATPGRPTYAGGTWHWPERVED